MERAFFLHVPASLHVPTLDGSSGEAARRPSSPSPSLSVARTAASQHRNAERAIVTERAAAAAAAPSTTPAAPVCFHGVYVDCHASAAARAAVGRCVRVPRDAGFVDDPARTVVELGCL